MANTYKAVNTTQGMGGGGGGNSGESFFVNFSTVDWNLSGDQYVITVLKSDHEKGTAPGVQVFVIEAGHYVKCEVNNISINNDGDITISIPQSPDLRFNGRVVILE
jgi:hypothetical protein